MKIVEVKYFRSCILNLHLDISFVNASYFEEHKNIEKITHKCRPLILRSQQFSTVKSPNRTYLPPAPRKTYLYLLPAMDIYFYGNVVLSEVCQINGEDGQYVIFTTVLSMLEQKKRYKTEMLLHLCGSHYRAFRPLWASVLEQNPP